MFTVKTAFFTAFLICLPHSHLLAQEEFVAIQTIAGNGKKGKPIAGSALKVPVSNPFGIHPLSDGNLAIVSFDEHVILKLDMSTGSLNVVCGLGDLPGTDGDMAMQVKLKGPHEIQVDQQNNIYVADTFQHRVGRFQADDKNAKWIPVAGSGAQGFSGDGKRATLAKFNEAYSIALSQDLLFVADLKNHRIREIDLKTNVVRTICGTGKKALPVDGKLAINQPLAGPRSLAVDSDNLWIVLREGNSVWRIDRSTGRIFHVAGTGKRGFTGDGGPAKSATLSGPKGIAVSPGEAIFIADTENNAVRKVDLSEGVITTVCGATGKKGFDGDGTVPQKRMLARPHGLFLLPNGDLLIGDSENHRVRKLVVRKSD